MTRRIGILAIQGDFEAHERAVARIGATATRVLREKDLDGLDGLILPGGESTTISKGMDRLRLWEPIRTFAEAGQPVLGTCAGAILLAREARAEFARHAPVPTLGLLEAVAVRNAYGTQVDSFRARVDPDSSPSLAGLSGVFIRAPQLESLGPARGGARPRRGTARPRAPGPRAGGHVPPRAHRRPPDPRAATARGGLGRSVDPRRGLC